MLGRMHVVWLLRSSVLAAEANVWGIYSTAYVYITLLMGTFRLKNVYGASVRAQVLNRTLFLPTDFLSFQTLLAAC